jgi:hypothetical protein
MSASQPALSLGFLTVVNNPELGLLGGYLLLNAAGRPLEFHCTAPVRPTRAQEILYGQTLGAYLYGEQIGQALLAATKLRPLVVCTDSERVLAARDYTHYPLVLVHAGEASEGERREGEAPAEPFRLGRNDVATARHYASDRQAIVAGWPREADSLDLNEPFARIREALAEAQKSARAA